MDPGWWEASPALCHPPSGKHLPRDQGVGPQPPVLSWRPREVGRQGTGSGRTRALDLFPSSSLLGAAPGGPQPQALLCSFKRAPACLLQDFPPDGI